MTDGVITNKAAHLHAALHAALHSALVRETGDAVRIDNLAQMAGGASQEMWQLDVTIATGEIYPLVARRQLGGKIFDDALDLTQEFRVLQATYESGVPVPRPRWLLPDLLGCTTYLMQRLEGETVGRRIVKAPELAAARAALPAQMGSALASIHAVDTHSLRAILPAPTSTSVKGGQAETPAQAHIRRMESDLDRIGEPHPAIEIALRWLRQNEPPPPDRLVLVHGDYRLGNMVVRPEGLAGVLDWEFAHIGEPAEDLAWGMVREWRFGMDRLHFSGISQPAPFFAAYEARSGSTIDPARVAYWEVLGNVNWAVGSLNQARRHLSGQSPNLEFASLGRRCAEIELEALSLIQASTTKRGSDAGST